MKITFNLGTPVSVTASLFQTGRLYRCVKASTFHPRYVGMIAWKQARDTEYPRLRKDCVYGIQPDSNLIEGTPEIGLLFNSEFLFEPLDKSAQITIEPSPVLIP